MKQIAIVGGGAAGFFAALNLKELAVNADITIYEGAAKELAKLAITGGGRCNLTNSFEGVGQLSAVYPRGDKLMKRAFGVFDYKDTYSWFEKHGVRLVTQEDHCVFPRSQDAMEIVNLLKQRSQKLGVITKVSHRVNSIEKEDGRFKISFSTSGLRADYADIVIVTTGGNSRKEGFSMLDSLPVKIIDPVPSLFSFCIPNDSVTELMGTVVDNVQLSLQGTKFKSDGILLITHWGMSGPAILKLSSYAARMLHQCNYDAKMSVNWCGKNGSDFIQNKIEETIREHGSKQLVSVKLCDVTSRLWQHLLKRANLVEERRLNELGQKGINKLINTLTNDEYHIKGKNKFKEEFVTCGGVSLDSVNLSTLECRECPNLYFAGEVLDVDAITGGFNLQAAWSMGFVVTQSILGK